MSGSYTFLISGSFQRAASFVKGWEQQEGKEARTVRVQDPSLPIRPRPRAFVEGGECACVTRVQAVNFVQFL